MRNLLLPFVVSGLLVSCHSQQPASSGATTFGSAADKLFFSLQRTPCFGKCPAYTVEIDADGSARYTGRSNAPREGEFTGQVEKAAMQALYDRASSIGFFGFQDKYDGQVTDLPSTIIRVNANGQDKKVVGRVKTPLAFRPFAEFADSLMGRVSWTKVEGTK